MTAPHCQEYWQGLTHCASQRESKHNTAAPYSSTPTSFTSYLEELILSFFASRLLLLLLLGPLQGHQWKQLYRQPASWPVQPQSTCLTVRTDCWSRHPKECMMCLHNTWRTSSWVVIISFAEAAGVCVVDFREGARVTLCGQVDYEGCTAAGSGAAGSAGAPAVSSCGASILCGNNSTYSGRRY